MTAPVGDLLAGVRSLDGLWSVEALSLALGSGSFYPDWDSRRVEVIEVDVHVADFAGAERIATRHHLAPLEQTAVAFSTDVLPTGLRRIWVGWVATAPGEVPVSVKVTAFEDLADHAPQTGPGARDGWEEVPLFGDGSDTDDETADESGVKAAA